MFCSKTRSSDSLNFLKALKVQLSNQRRRSVAINNPTQAEVGADFFEAGIFERMAFFQGRHSFSTNRGGGTAGYYGSVVDHEFIDETFIEKGTHEVTAGF